MSPAVDLLGWSRKVMSPAVDLLGWSRKVMSPAVGLLYLVGEFVFETLDFVSERVDEGSPICLLCTQLFRSADNSACCTVQSQFCWEG